MVYAGLDVHKRCTQICLEDESGALLERRILTERRRLLEEFGGKAAHANPAGVGDRE